jgi:hypothetical protein
MLLQLSKEEILAAGVTQVVEHLSSKHEALVQTPALLKKKRKKRKKRCLWLTPIILATQEAEIRRIVVQSQLRADSS